MLDIDRTRLLADAATVHLADMLVAMAIFGSVSAAMFTVLQEGLRVYAVGVSRAESQQSGRVAGARLGRGTRTARPRARPPALVAVSGAGPPRIAPQRRIAGRGV